MSSIKRNSFFKGIRFRLTLVYSTLFGLFICIFAFILSNQYLEAGRRDFDSALLNFAIDLSASAQLDISEFKSGIKVPGRELKKKFPFVLGETIFMLRSLEGKIITHSETYSNLPNIPYLPDLAFKEDYTHRFHDMTINGELYRAINVKITNSKGQALVLQVASPAGIIEEQRNRNLLINILTIPFLIIISSIASYLIAGNALTPIKNLTDTANSIAAKNLSQRVQVVDSGDEVGELSRTFNNLLERLEHSFKAQEHFVANASHQLNTPLAIIKGELNVLQSKSRTPEEITRFHKSLREELERLIELVKNMLLISRVEAAQENFVFHPIRLDELLLGVTSRLRPKAREKGVVKRFNVSEELADSDDLIVMGEKQLLDSLFENLLDNAIKYSPPDTPVKITITAPEGNIEVWFQDEGPGIVEDEIEKILHQRFKRGSKSLLPGTGLGLPIASQIAEFHHAKIIYKRLEPHGSLFIVKFPK